MSDPRHRPSGAPRPTVAGGRRRLAFSEDRTIWLQVQDDGRAMVRKVFETGDATAAEDEARLGLCLGGPGFVTYLGAERDPMSGRPSTLTTLAPGRDLWQLVRAEGPLPPAQVAGLGVALCRVLRRVHTIAIHRDVKPANVLVHQRPGETFPEVTLLDAEHAWLLARPHLHGTFSGGTHGWSPPEAYDGALPSPGFDVFGLGATLWYAATGRPPLAPHEAMARRLPCPRRLAGLPPELTALLVACLAPVPTERPELAWLEDRLARWREQPTTPATRSLDAALVALQSADMVGAEKALASTPLERASPSETERHRTLVVLLRRRARLLQRHPLPTDGTEADARDGLAQLAPRARTLIAFAARFPAHAELRRAIDALRRRLAQALDALPERTANHKRAARFVTANEELLAVRAAITAATALGGLQPDLPDTVAPSALQRTPLRLVTLAFDDLTAAQQRHDAMIAALEQAEASLNLGAAAQAIDHATAIYSGASEIVANLKDRLHRLTYFVERLAQPRETLAPLISETTAAGVSVDLAPAQQCLERCRQQCDGGLSAKSPLGLRALQRTMHELVEELPAAATGVADARAVLTRALQAVSDHAWTMIDDSRTKLAAVPIPIRPLQNLIARLDHLRLIDALVDSQRGTRAELLDEVERVRSDLDQARTTRDRIASGARAAMERGHLTTALYDMARVVDRYDVPGGDLEEARKRKHAVEEAVRENHRLAAQYAELEDDPSSAVDERVELLEHRRRVLEFLSESVAAERATTYTQDRLDVEVRILQERTADAERQIDTLTDPAARLQLAATTLAKLNHFASAQRTDVERLGRVQRIREHWESLRVRAQGDVTGAEAARREARRRVRRSRLARALVAALTLALAVTLYFLARGASAPDALSVAASGVRDQLTAPLRVEGFDPVQAVIELDRFAGGLEHSGLLDCGIDGAAELTRATRALVDEVSTTARGNIDPQRWMAALDRARSEHTRARAAFVPGSSAAAVELASALVRFEAAAEFAAVVLAARACTDDRDKEVVRRYVADRRLAIDV